MPITSWIFLKVKANTVHTWQIRSNTPDFGWSLQPLSRQISMRISWEVTRPVCWAEHRCLRTSRVVKVGWAPHRFALPGASGAGWYGIFCCLGRHFPRVPILLLWGIPKQRQDTRALRLQRAQRNFLRQTGRNMNYHSNGPSEVFTLTLCQTRKLHSLARHKITELVTGTEKVDTEHMDCFHVVFCPGELVTKQANTVHLTCLMSGFSIHWI